jgi:uncharacterized protein (TIGR02231 family)
METNLKEIKSLTIDAPVSTVTLLEDRALVHRVGKTPFSPGLWRVKVENVSPIMANKSLRAEFSGDYPNARIDDVRVRREMIVKEADKPEEIQGLEAELRSLVQTLKNLEEDRQNSKDLALESKQVLNHGIQEWMQDAVWGQFDLNTAQEQIQTLFQQSRDCYSEILNSDRTQEELQQQINDLKHRIASLSRPDRFYITYLEIDLMIPTEGEYEIAIDYVVPNALWRPWHQARLLLEDPPLPPLKKGGDNRPKFSFQCDGCVWQRTGEDWENVDLVFSTARPSLGSDPPLLTDDVLNVKDKEKKIFVDMRDRTIEKPGLGSDATAGTKSPSTQGDVTVPGVDDGGEVRILRSRTKATIPSDGRPYRIPLFTFECDAKIEYILMPEIVPQVVLKSEQTNPADFPILAGPVDLLRSTELVGKTSVGFIAPGEKFALGWGPDAAMRVQRTQTEKSEKHPITRWKTVTTTTQLFLSNIGEESRTIETTERVPVSELEKVKVEAIGDKTTEGITPDKNGFCHWTLTLDPYTQQEVTLTYKLSSAPDVEGI